MENYLGKAYSKNFEILRKKFNKNYNKNTNQKDNNFLLIKKSNQFNQRELKDMEFYLTLSTQDKLIYKNTLENNMNLCLIKYLNLYSFILEVSKEPLSNLIITQTNLQNIETQIQTYSNKNEDMLKIYNELYYISNNYKHTNSDLIKTINQTSNLYEIKDKEVTPNILLKELNQQAKNAIHCAKYLDAINFILEENFIDTNTLKIRKVIQNNLLPKPITIYLKNYKKIDKKINTEINYLKNKSYSFLSEKNQMLQRYI